MDDFALVLNAGSSSLKFNVYQRPEKKIGVSHRAVKLKESELRRDYLRKMTKAKAW